MKVFVFVLCWERFIGFERKLVEKIGLNKSKVGVLGRERKFDREVDALSPGSALL